MEPKIKSHVPPNAHIEPQSVDYDLVNGPCRIKAADIPVQAGYYILIQPDMGFTRNSKGEAVNSAGVEITEETVNREVYQCHTGTIVSIGDMAFRHREMEDVRGEYWLGTWPKLGDRVLWRDGGIGMHTVLNGVDLFSIIDEDVRMILNDNIKPKGYIANSAINTEEMVSQIENDDRLERKRRQRLAEQKAKPSGLQTPTIIGGSGRTGGERTGLTEYEGD